LQEVELHELINFHNSCFVTTSVAVVGSGEDGDYVSFVSPVVAVHDQLMSSSYSDEAIGVVELLRDILSERITSSSGGDTPTASVIRVGPEQVTDRAFMRYFLDSVELLNLVKSVDTGRKSSMEAEDGVINDSGQGEIIEQLGEEHPDVRVTIFPQALVIEAIDLGDLSHFVVTSENSNSVLVPHFQSD
jgi:hypothetical protein